MPDKDKQIYRLELQVSELIRLVANLNERLQAVEQHTCRKRFFKVERPPKSRMTS